MIAVIDGATQNTITSRNRTVLFRFLLRSAVCCSLVLIVALVPCCDALASIPTPPARGGPINRSKPHANNNNNNNKIVWFRPHAVRTLDNEALRVAVEEYSKSMVATTNDGIAPAPGSLRFVFLWDRPLLLKTRQDSGGGTASDVFLVRALDALNQTLGGNLDVVDNSDCAASEVEAHSNRQSRQDCYAKSVTDALGAYVGSNKNNDNGDDDGNDTTEILYLETFDSELEQTLNQQLQQSTISLVSPFGKIHTLLDYSELDVVQLVRDAIHKHPFASPLIPFVDYVVESLLSSDSDNDNAAAASTSGSIDLSAILDDPSFITPSSAAATSDNNSQSSTLHPLSFLSIQDLLLQVGTTRQTDWGRSIAQRWPATENATALALDDFCQAQYATLLDGSPGGSDKSSSNQQPKNKKKRPNHLASHLSPYLARGLVSPKQVYQALLQVEQSRQQGDDNNGKEPELESSASSSQSGSNSFLRRLAWRDYAYASSLAFPNVVSEKQPIRSGYEQSKDNKHPLFLQKWKDGCTGFPLVDAGMRQLVLEGFMPQQVRLAASACLVEGLNVPWELGMQHFEEFLVDYDPVINTHMWMNAGGVGLDPYYIGLDYKKRPYWDTDGSYVRTWCPELADLPDRIEVPPEVAGTGGTNTVDTLYTPWKAPPSVLKDAHVELGESYPDRIADERDGRRTFLQSLRDCRTAWPANTIDKSGNDMIDLGGESIGAFTPRSLKF